MTFGRKIFLALCLLVTGACMVIGYCVFHQVRESRTRDYLSRYGNLGTIMAGTFYEMETLADLVGQNALAVLQQIDKTGALPDDNALDALAKSLNVMSFYAQNDKGYFTRSSDLPIAQQVNTIFDYSDEYRKLITGETPIARTPVIPGWPNSVPAKFTMVPNHDRSGILEVGYDLEYLGRMLKKIVRSDRHVLSVGLYAPNGYQLGKIDRSGKYEYGIKDAMPSPTFGHRLGKDVAEFNIKVASPVEACPECTVKGTQIADGPYYYLLHLAVSTEPLMADIAGASRAIALVVAATALLATALAWVIAHSLVRGIRDISATAGSIMSSGDTALRVTARGGKDEVYALAQTFNAMLTTLEDNRAKLVEAERLRSIAKLASEVAHDIRSPIAALEAVSKLSQGQSDGERHLVFEATKRIRDIANNLLTHHRDTANPEHGQAPGAEWVVSVMQSAVSQKRAEFAHRDVEIDIDVDDASSDAFVRVSLGDFKRTISNLLTNAVESTDKGGRVHVVVARRGAKVTLEIRDNGCGMTPEQIARARAGGYTSKGAAGNGLGLSTSIRRIAQWGGTLEVASRVGEGSCITIGLPLTRQAAWFASCVDIDPRLTTVIIDDEGFIGTLWKKRLLLANPSLDESRVVFFRRSSDFLSYFRSNSETVGTCLVDYEFVDNAMTGVELVKSLGIVAQSYLITSHDEESDVRRSCLELGLRMVPKTLVNQIPIRCATAARSPRPDTAAGQAAQV